MSTKTTLKIEDLPETFELYPDDEIYIFHEKSGKFEKFETSIGSLSTLFYIKESANKLKEKSDELVKLSGEFINWIKTNYPTEAYISANYSTSAYFHDIYDPIAEQAALSTYFSNYASKDYGEYKLTEAKTNHETMRYDGVIDTGSMIVQNINLTNN